MKKIAILVIASFKQLVYKHYINTYWIDLINYTNQYKSNIAIYLLFDRNMSLVGYENIRDNIIVDGNSIYNNFISQKETDSRIPTILSKTVYAFELLKDKVDIIFRTNLSSLLNLDKLEAYIQANDIIYSGAYVWHNALRENLIYYGLIGPTKSIKTLGELDDYEGNTFISGCGYFLNKHELNNIIDKKHLIRYDLIDDIAIGLMCKAYKILDDFLIKIIISDTREDIIKKLDKDYIHIRLEHLPLEKAQMVYHIVKEKYPNYLPLNDENFQNVINIKVF